MTMEYADSSSNAVSKIADSTAGWMGSAIDTVSQTWIGQTILKYADRFLWVVEKSAQWSLPCQEIAAEENGKTFGRMNLVRPLPWILFLPGLVILRGIRGGLNVGAFVLGYSYIQPSDVVKFVQRSRRKLRSVKVSGMKNLRRKSYNNKEKRLSVNEAKRALIRSIRLTLSTLSCLDNSKSSPSPPPTRIHITGLDLEATPTLEEKSTTESAGSPTHTDKKRKFSGVSSDDQDEEESEEESLEAKINRLAMEDSMNDPDFYPGDCSTSESSTSSGNDEAELEVSISELADVKEDILKPLPDDIRKKIQPTKPYSHNVQNDGDTFYSPISSGSASPERSSSPIPNTTSTEKSPK